MAVNTWLTAVPEGPVTVWVAPSPQVIANVKPAARSTAEGSAAVRVKVRAWPRTPSEGPVTAAVGTALSTVMVGLAAGPAAPSLSVAVRLTTYVPLSSGVKPKPAELPEA